MPLFKQFQGFYIPVLLHLFGKEKRKKEKKIGLPFPAILYTSNGSQMPIFGKLLAVTSKLDGLSANPNIGDLLQ